MLLATRPVPTMAARNNRKISAILSCMLGMRKTALPIFTENAAAKNRQHHEQKRELHLVGRHLAEGEQPDDHHDAQNGTRDQERPVVPEEDIPAFLFDRAPELAPQRLDRNAVILVDWQRRAAPVQKVTRAASPFRQIARAGSERIVKFQHHVAVLFVETKPVS